MAFTRNPVINSLVVFFRVFNVLMNFTCIIWFGWSMPSSWWFRVNNHIETLRETRNCIPIWIPTVRLLGKSCLAVLMSISLAAAGEAGWKWGW